MKYQIDLAEAHTKAFFYKNGFALIRNVFSSEEIQTARHQLLSIFETSSDYEGDWDNRTGINSLRADLFNRYEALRWIFFKPEIHNALKQILGEEIGFVPEMVAHRKGFGGWHKDTTSQERAGYFFHYDPAWMMVECAIYLQDNHSTYGGGLDVIPGSHLAKDDKFSKPVNLLTKAANKISTYFFDPNIEKNEYHIPSKAGDFVFF